MGTLAVLAPAKINLYLHVVGRRADLYHLLDSLVAFADIGDRVTVAASDRLSLTVSGPESSAIAALGEDNLVMRAARLFAAEAAHGDAAEMARRAALRLEKMLPTASGIGGGSSDAAATLRLLDRLSSGALGPAVLADIAARLGADLPACLAARPVWVGGIGDRLDPAEGLPSAGIVLANPRIALPTATVFRMRRGPFSDDARFAPMPRDAAGLAAALAARRNDLTEAALTLVPEIARVLDALGGLPGSLLARMSGSGATCFALFPDRAAALAGQAGLAAARPGWWSAAGTLIGTAPPVEETWRGRGPAAPPTGAAHGAC